MGQSLREIAKWMDSEGTDKRARRLYGNGPPFDLSRPQPYDLNELSFSFEEVDVDYPSADPPDTRVVGGPVDLEAIEGKVTYDGIRYLDAPPGKAASGTTHLSGDQNRTPQDVYEQNLFFADQNAYDLGMINRTKDNGTLPKGYTDKGIIESHRWVDSDDNDDSAEEWRSIRNVVDRHRKGVRHRVLSQNVGLLLAEGLPPRLRKKAKRFGRLFGAAGFDIVGMSEVVTKKQKSLIKKKYNNKYLSSELKRAGNVKDLGVLVGRRREEDTVTRKVINTESKKFEESGPTFSLKEGWLRIDIEVPPLPGNPKFEIFVTHLQPVSKGNVDKNLQAKIAQMRELRDVIKKRNNESPERPKILMGDFNIRSGGRPSPMEEDSGVEKGEYYNNFLHQMHSVGMQNIWLTHGGPGPPHNRCNKKRGCDYICSPFEPKSEEYYQGRFVDHVFLEKPRSSHDLQIDVARTMVAQWPNIDSHPGIAFNILTSPRN